MNRFNILVLNYNRLNSFFNNFYKIQNFNTSLDCITILSCSHSKEESSLVKKFEDTHQVKINYLIRRNYGIEQAARIEYFSCLIEEASSVYNSQFIFQFQEHYLDTEATYSRYGEQLNFRIKGDVVPDNIYFDLDFLYDVFTTNNIQAAFCDRANPCWFLNNGKTYIAPNGGNFFLRTELLKSDGIRRQLTRMLQSCDNTYSWAVYVEFKWGMLFFNEGNNYYDIKRKKIYSHFPKEEFNIFIDTSPLKFSLRLAISFYESGKIKLEYTFLKIINKINQKINFNSITLH